MATLQIKKGRGVIQFTREGLRKFIRIGKSSPSTARTFLFHVESLISAKDHARAIPSDTQAWLSKIAPRLRRRLVKSALVDGDNRSTILPDICDAYITRRSDVKPGTRTKLKQAKDKLVSFFGADRDIARRPISKGEAVDWRRHVASSHAQATVSLHVKKVRQIFADAMDRNLIEDNPFAQVKAGSQSNPARQAYIDAETIAMVIAKCPSEEWKTLFTLARFGALRIPSESSLLKWSDIDWAHGRITVYSPKTEHQGKAKRMIPLVPQLLERLLALRAVAENTDGFVLAKLRGENLRTVAVRIIKAAGFEPWPRLFHNLRSTCQTDWASLVPIHAACAMAGNTQAVAITHYLQLTDDHYMRLIEGNSGTENHTRNQKDNGGGANPPAFAPDKSGFSVKRWPLSESELAAIPVRNLIISENFIQKTLDALLEAAPHMRARDIGVLQSEVDAAKRRSAGGAV